MTFLFKDIPLFLQPWIFNQLYKNTNYNKLHYLDIWPANYQGQKMFQTVSMVILKQRYQITVYNFVMKNKW